VTSRRYRFSRSPDEASNFERALWEAGSTLDDHTTRHVAEDRMSSNTFAGCLNGIQKLILQAGTLPLIPKKGVFNIGRRRRADNDGYHGLWLRTR
jgi:hypothetical protein